MKLSEMDFNWESLPETEIIPCCLWEYARESQKLRTLVRRIAEGQKLNDHVNINIGIHETAIEQRDDLIAEASKIRSIGSEEDANKAIAVGRKITHWKKTVAQAVNASKHALDIHLNAIDERFDRIQQELQVAFNAGSLPTEALTSGLQRQLDHIKSEQPSPRILFWKGLVKSRSKIVGIATDTLEFCPPLPFPSPWLSLSAGSRERLSSMWPLMKSRKSSKGAKVPQLPDPIQEQAFSAKPDSEESEIPFAEVTDSGTLTGRFCIKCDFVDEDIVIAFRHWLKTNRPAFSVANDRRGQDLDHFRVALRRLGIMRRIKTNPGFGNADRNKDAKRVLSHFEEFVKVGLVCDAELPEDCESECPLNWPDYWE